MLYKYKSALTFIAYNTVLRNKMLFPYITQKKSYLQIATLKTKNHNNNQNKTKCTFKKNWFCEELTKFRKNFDYSNLDYSNNRFAFNTQKYINKSYNI